MQRVCCATYDRASQLYGQPFFAQSNGVAIRAFTDNVNNASPDNTMHTHPSDFELYNLGSFDDETGMLGTLAGPNLLARGEDVILKGV